MKVIKEKAEVLLMEYAAGTLDEASSLLVASYITVCPEARRYYRKCESVGGALMENFCEPVAMADGSLKAVLGRLDSEPKSEPCAQQVGFCRAQQLPSVIATHISRCSGPPAQWRMLAPGVRFYTLKTTDPATGIVRLVKLARGAHAPRHRHNGREMTLVLDGGYSDEFGSYRAGDLVIAEPATVHTPVADREKGCTCLMLNTAPIRFTGRISVMLNIFIR